MQGQTYHCFCLQNINKLFDLTTDIKMIDGQKKRFLKFPLNSRRINDPPKSSFQISIIISDIIYGIILYQENIKVMQFLFLPSSCLGGKHRKQL